MSKYIPFTTEQKERAASVDLEEFLRRRGEKLITSGRDKRLASDHSITIRGCEWFDHATEQGGRAISFVKQFYGLSYPDAMSLLLGDDLGGSYPAAKEKVPEPAKPFVLPPQSESMRRVYAYLLQKRCIDREILNAFVRKKLIYESCEKSKDGTKEYHNAVFVGFDEHGVPRHGHKRGLYTMGQGYRGNIEGSDPKHSFHYLGGEDTLYVFEAPIDLLSYMAGLMIQNLSRELFAVADENGGKLKNRVILFCDELGTMPPFDILPLFSAGRSRRLTLVPIIQSLAQLEKNYGKEGASILMDNCQDVICGGFAPNSEAAETFSKALGSRTVLSGSVSRGKNDPSQSLQMMERPLLTADELKSIPKGSFIVQKTGCHPMRTRLRLFLEWGITFEEEYRVEEQAARRVYYADQNALTRAIVRKYPPKLPEQKTTRSVKGEGQLHDAPMQEMVVAEDIDYDRMPHKRAPYNLPRQEVDR